MYRLYNGINATELEPSEFSVGQNYPNPFKNKTVIKYCVAYKTKVQIIVYNSEGKLIEKLVDEEKQPGTYEVEFNTSIDFFCKSRYLLNGDYFYRMIAGDYSSEKKWFCINNQFGRFNMKTLLQTLFFFLLVTQICFAQWFFQNPNPTRNTLNDVVLIDENNGWAVGDNGTIIKTTNGGTDWILQESETTNSLRGVCFADVSIGWAVGELGTILKTTNGGASWIQQTSGISDGLNDVSFTNATTGTVVGENGTILRTTDAGITWTSQTGGGSIALEGVCFVNSNIGWAVGYDKILGTTNGGTTWSLQLDGIGGQDGVLHSVYFLDENIGWVVGWRYLEGVIIKTTNGGTTWTFQTSGTVAPLVDVCFADVNKGWIVGYHYNDRGLILKTIDGGLTWTRQASKSSAYINAVSFCSANTGIVVGYYGTILNSNDGGNTWIYPPTGNTNDLNSICFSNVNTGTVVGDFGIILHTTNTGQDWITQTSGTGYNLYDVCFSDLNTCWVVGDSGIILKTTNDGINWLAQTSGTTTPLNGICFVDANTGWVVGGPEGIILKTTNGGTDWIQQFNTDTDSLLNDVYFTDTNTGTAVGGRKGMGASSSLILRTTDGGTNWLQQFYNPGWRTAICQGVHFTNDTTGFAVGYIVDILDRRNEIIRTTNGGIDWMIDSTIHGTYGYLFDVFFSDFNNGTVVGTTEEWNQGIILRTTDAGANWINQTSGTQNALKGVYFTDNLTGWIVGDYGTILHTINGGVPVELTSFTATTNGKEVMLNWSTATELNNQGFEIERSEDNINFTKIGFVPGFGTTTEPKSYSHLDQSVNSGTNYYRLKQVDYDGSYEYSDVVEVEFRTFNSYLLEQNYPNPFNPTTTIGFSIQNKSTVKITILNAIGEEVAVVLNEERESGFYQVEFNAIGLPSGVYFYRLKAGSFTETKKMLLLK